MRRSSDRSTTKWPAAGGQGLSRRGLLAGGLGATALFAGGGLAELFAATPGGIEGAELLGILPFQPEPTEMPFGTRIASGLDGRILTDLSKLETGRLVTPPEEFYVRTTRPERLDLERPWTLSLEGLVVRPRLLGMAELEPLAEDQGLHLLECAGNSRFVRYGLISVGRWSGISIGALLDRVRPRRGASWLRVTGFDDHTRGSTNSTPGCSWIFERTALEAAGAFLATGLGGEPLSPDHGFPLRLVVPGWYGCSAVKWVERIEWVDSGQRATSQMLEFAERTHQEGTPELAADYRPALVKMSAMPVRVEKWRRGEELVYRVVGILWGGERSPDHLEVRFSPSEPFVPVTHPPEGGVRGRWVLWSHEWRPAEPGRYLIQPKIDDASQRSPRMPQGHYWRGVEITEV